MRFCMNLTIAGCLLLMTCGEWSAKGSGCLFCDCEDVQMSTAGVFWNVWTDLTEEQAIAALRKLRPEIVGLNERMISYALKHPEVFRYWDAVDKANDHHPARDAMKSVERYTRRIVKGDYPYRTLRRFVRDSLVDLEWLSLRCYTLDRKSNPRSRARLMTACR